MKNNLGSDEETDIKHPRKKFEKVERVPPEGYDSSNDFFEDVYNKFVKNKRIITMMDTYDVNKKIPTLKDDKLVIASIATDRDNIILLCKKIGQNMIDRRSLASMFKKTYLLLGNNSILSDDVLKSRIEKDDSDTSYLDEMAKCFDEYKKSYDKEYELV